MYEALLEALQSGTTVVTANSRLARSLTTAYGKRQISRGLQVWPSPEILSWSAFLDELWTQSQMHGGSAVGLKLLSDTDARVLWEEVARAEP